ncbi:MAG: hypothetical protein IJ650_03360 [Paludibacteraceae bacterium]|nr:hypothetical protein [Paludibacteraceae bacterium]
MKRLSVFPLIVCVALSLSAASPYLDFITYAERDSAKNLIRDLSSVFSETGEPLMTDLYVIGRTWAEVQYFNLVSFENWTMVDQWRVLTMPYNVTGILLLRDIHSRQHGLHNG